MRYLKIIGLLAVAALTWASVGASTSSADVLCKVAPNASGECPTSPGAQDYASGTTFSSGATNARFTQTGSTFGDIVCQVSSLDFKQTGTGSNTSGVSVPIEVTDLIFDECKLVNSGIWCTVTTTSGYTGSIKATDDSGDGRLSVSGAKSLTITCGTVENCTFRMAAWSMPVVGGNPGSLLAEAQPLEWVSGGFGCPNAVDVDAKYVFSGTNTSFWVATKNA